LLRTRRKIKKNHAFNCEIQRRKVRDRLIKNAELSNAPKRNAKKAQGTECRAVTKLNAYLCSKKGKKMKKRGAKVHRDEWAVWAFTPTTEAARLQRERFVAKQTSRKGGKRE